MIDKPWWSLRGKARAEAKANAWQKTGVTTFGVAILKNETESAYRGGSGIIHRYTDETSRRVALLLAASPLNGLPDGIAAEIPAIGYLYLSCEGRTSLVLTEKPLSFLLAVKELYEPEPQPTIHPDSL